MNTLSINDSDTNQWKCRNIEPQDTVFVKRPITKYFKNYFDFQSWKIDNSLSIPIYLIQKYEKKKVLERLSIFIGEDEESILVVKVGFYDFERGISFPKEDVFI